MKPLPPSFFARSTVTVARDLLGKIIFIKGMAARIVETEAYTDDPASHAYTKTERSALMYDTYGHVYVYLIYGMYHCLNFTTEKNAPGAVLIRAVEPLEGIARMKKNRKGNSDFQNFCSGPGKLCSALGITRGNNGLQIGKEIDVLDDRFKVNTIASTSRIGIKVAQELQWRFFIKGNEYVSKVKFNK